MKIAGCDLHAKQQAISRVNTETGEFTENTLAHEGNQVREFYSALQRHGQGQDPGGSQTGDPAATQFHWQNY
jgi:hypothetical protein